MKRTRTTTVEPMTKRGVVVRTKTTDPDPTVMRRSVSNKKVIEIIPGDVEIILVKPLQIKGAIYFAGYTDDGLTHWVDKKMEALLFTDEDQAHTYASFHNCILRIRRGR